MAITSLTATTAACGATTCSTQVQTTCPIMQVQCSPKAACPVGFTTVANGNSNKCYLEGSADVSNFAAASMECASKGGSLLEHESPAELALVRTLILDVTSSYYIGYTDIGNKAYAPVGIQSGRGLPANAGIINPAFAATELDCESVKKTGGYSAVASCVGAAKVLCEARLDTVRCVCP